MMIDVRSGGDAVLAVNHRLTKAGVDNPRLDARLLVAHVLEITPTRLFSYPETQLNAGQVEQLCSLVERRAQREPMARILGSREFWSLNFKVNESTLVPRPDSETLIEAVLARIEDRNAPLSILDLGTGSGCLLLALLSELKAATGLGVDISEHALKTASGNAQTLGFGDRARFQRSNWFENIDKKEMPFDLIICNPPYIPDDDITRLEPDVSKYDPYVALSGGSDGLDAYRKLIPKMSDSLTLDGMIAIEVGMNQALDVAGFGEAGALELEEICKDIAGLDRVLVFRLKP